MLGFKPGATINEGCYVQIFPLKCGDPLRRKLIKTRLKEGFVIFCSKCCVQYLFQGSSVAVLIGAVLYGLDPSIVHVRRAMKTYGIGVIKPFLYGKHPQGNKTRNSFLALNLDTWVCVYICRHM